MEQTGLLAIRVKRYGHFGICVMLPTRIEQQDAGIVLWRSNLKDDIEVMDKLIAFWLTLKNNGAKHQWDNN